MVKVRVRISRDEPVFVLEDDARRQTWFMKNIPMAVIKPDVKSAMEILKERRFTYYFLDHDLGGEQMVEPGANTGYAIAKYLHLDGETGQQVLIHSWNEPAAERMKALLPKAAKIPFGWFEIDLQ